MRCRSNEPDAARFSKALSDLINGTGNHVTVHTEVQPGITPTVADRTYRCGMWPLSPYQAGQLQWEGVDNVAEAQPYSFNFEKHARVNVGDLVTPRGRNQRWRIISVLLQSIDDTTLIFHCVGVREANAGF